MIYATPVTITGEYLHLLFLCRRSGSEVSRGGREIRSLHTERLTMLKSEFFTCADKPHWSVVVENATGEIEDLATCVMHDTKEACDQELQDLFQGDLA